MKLYDTATKTYQTFVAPDNQSPVKIYVCGITPYDSAHLGHIFTFMTYDLLQRNLQDKGLQVQMVRNVTDVDEPIYRKAAELNIDYRDLAAAETKQFQTTLQQLNFLEPFAQPLASDYIMQMADAVQQMLDSGSAYRLSENSDIYFDVGTQPDYTQFSGFTERVIMGLSSERGGNPELKTKRNPLDFLLWKTITDQNDPAQWDTQLGIGRPGWHIECSVMSHELLGAPFDIHGGGSDLIFPHHSSEIAQSHALGQSEMARLWVHVSPLLYNGEKMSKSLGNLVFAKDLLTTHHPSVIRLALMHYHHRVGGEWLPELLIEAQNLWDAFVHHIPLATPQATQDLLQDIRAELDDDINTLEVIDAMHQFIKSPVNQDSDNQSGTDSNRQSQAAADIKNVFDLLGLVN